MLDSAIFDTRNREIGLIQSNLIFINSTVSSLPLSNIPSTLFMTSLGKDNFESDMTFHLESYSQHPKDKLKQYFMSTTPNMRLMRTQY